MPRSLLTASLLVAVLAVSCGSAAAPEPLRQGREVYGNKCAACHGAAGQGGVGPTLAGVTETWPSCTDQIRWITLGSEGWREQEGDSYGATAKPVLGGMPGHGETLGAAEIAAVAAFERVTYGGAEEAATLAACGVGG